MTISTSSSCSLAETVSARHSLNLDFTHGRLFYGVAIVSTLVAAGIVLIPGAPLLAMTLTVNDQGRRRPRAGGDRCHRVSKLGQEDR
jgi:hypothetical protein